ncbi:hypothetical protein Ccrd_001741 [Cynara cardunculus var. scolymus]|uniref:Uncharacterized protein n=1 Tax=Cynara cardunculus var. scolymus TaxID=59895 RepID=A0A103XSR0_CYNCS|nr:hypothetical protein Ccrd_001741 [Cynara cardunculus var. scolymus]
MMIKNLQKLEQLSEADPNVDFKKPQLGFLKKTDDHHKNHHGIVDSGECAISRCMLIYIQLDAFPGFWYWYEDFVEPRYEDEWIVDLTCYEVCTQFDYVFALGKLLFPPVTQVSSKKVLTDSCLDVVNRFLYICGPWRFCVSASTFASF